MTWSLAYLTALTFLAALTTRKVLAYALQNKIEDLPGPRSSHSKVTARGGGLAIVTIFCVSLLVLSQPLLAELAISKWRLIGVTLAALFIAGVGWWDDRASLSARFRIVVHCAAAALALYSWPPSSISEGVFSFFFLVGMTNLYNFMDGIDGIAASEAVFISVVFGFFAAFQGYFFFGLAVASLGAACLGFLRYNWSPAKIFMGDVGSGFLGFALALFAILGRDHELIPLSTFLIWIAYFIGDASLTLVIRLLLKKNVFEAHRDHGYQHAVRMGSSHRRVTLQVLAANLGFFLPLGWAAMRWPQFECVFLFAAYAPLLVYLTRLKAGREL